MRNYNEVYPASLNKNLKPVGYESLHPDFQNLFKEEEVCPPVYRRYISRCLVSPFGVIFKNGFIVRESLPYMSHWRQNILTLYKKIALGRVTRVKGPCLVAINPYYSNYGHWLIESMPRIYSTIDLHPSLTMLVPSQSPRFVIEYLKQFPFKDIYLVKENELVYCSEAILPNSFQFGQYHQALMRDMKSYLIQSISSTITTGKSYLLSRDKAAYRKSADEQKLMSQLTELGFEKLFAEDLSVRDQISVFSNTTFLVGIHSTGLNNCLFMPDHSTVVDFIVKDHYDISPYSTSQVSKHRFCYIPCERTYRDLKMNYDDPILDIESIVKRIKNLR